MLQMIEIQSRKMEMQRQQIAFQIITQIEWKPNKERQERLE